MSENDLAFPGAIGYGRHTVGGRGGKVYHVTNLDDDGPGSLRDACWHDHPRIVVFDVGGTIELHRQINLEYPYITIAGQTAPGGGICLKNSDQNMDSPLSWRNTHDVLISGLRSRPGIGGTSRTPGLRHGDSIDCFGNPVGETYNLYLYHCSGSWSVDEICDLSRVHDATIDSCLFAEPLNCATHSYTSDDPSIGHAKFMLLAYPGSRNVTVRRTVMAKGMDRHPAVLLESGTVDLVNNLIYGWGTDLAAEGGRVWVTSFNNQYGDFAANVIANYYKPGPQPANRHRLYYNYEAGNAGDTLMVYLAGNLDTQLGALNEIYHAQPEQSYLLMAGQPIGDVQWGPVLSAELAMTWATGALGAGASYRLNERGERVANRDSVDTRVLLDVQRGTGSIINHPDEVGGWPHLEPGTPLDWNDLDVPKAFAEMHPGADIETFIWS